MTIIPTPKRTITKMVTDEYGHTEPWKPTYVDVLDHGFVGLIDIMGDDSRVVNSARVSYGEGTKVKRSDRGLIRYLMKHHHTTPFESVEFQFHVKAPIFVLRQWMRHRAACLSGDTKITIRSKSNDSIEETTISNLGKLIDEDASALTRSEILTIDHHSNQATWLPIIDLWNVGKDTVYKVTTEHGDITMTGKHICLSDSGWETLNDIMKSFNNNKTRSLTYCPSGMSTVQSRIIGIEKLPDEVQVYDITVNSPLRSFVANGFLVHNSYNEYSGRYSIMEDVAYIPDQSNLAPQSKDRKQGRMKSEFDDVTYKAIVDVLTSSTNLAMDQYHNLINGPDGIADKVGRTMMNSGKDVELDKVIQDVLSSRIEFSMNGESIARELARIILPLNVYSQMYWKIDLHNLFHFLWLRADDHAQYEIRVYAEEIEKMISAYVPYSLEAYNDYKKMAKTLSRMELEVVSSAMNGQLDITDDEAVRGKMRELGCSEREIGDFLKLNKGE